MVSHDTNPSMEHDSSHSSHDEDEALQFPCEQDDKLATEINKMHGWLLQENYNTKNIKCMIDFYKKVTILKLLFILILLKKSFIMMIIVIPFSTVLLTFSILMLSL